MRAVQTERLKVAQKGGARWLESLTRMYPWDFHLVFSYCGPIVLSEMQTRPTQHNSVLSIAIASMAFSGERTIFNYASSRV